MADFLDEKLKEIQGRLRELRPLVEEFRRLEAAEQALSGVSGGSGGGGQARAQSSPGPRRATSRARGASGGGAANGRRGRPRGSGTRANQALDLVRNRPGITIPELAEAMDIKQNYLYRVMPSLAEQGLVLKSGRGWHARGDATAVAEEPPGADADATTPEGGEEPVQAQG